MAGAERQQTWRKSELPRKTMFKKQGDEGFKMLNDSVLLYMTKVLPFIPTYHHNNFYYLLLSFFLSFWDRMVLFSIGWPGTHKQLMGRKDYMMLKVKQKTRLALNSRNLLASATRVLGLKAYTTKAGNKFLKILFIFPLNYKCLPGMTELLGGRNRRVMSSRTVWVT